jgi:hypothetical protein
MRTRAVIEQAKGVLMAQQGTDADAAFEQLAAMSQHANVRLAELAAAPVGRVAPVPGEPATTPPAARSSGRTAAPTRTAIPAPRVAPRSAAGALPPPRAADYEAPQATHQVLASRIRATRGNDEVSRRTPRPAAGRGRPRWCCC